LNSDLFQCAFDGSQVGDQHDLLFVRQAQELSGPAEGFFARFTDAAVGRLATALRRAG